MARVVLALSFVFEVVVEISLVLNNLVNVSIAFLEIASCPAMVHPGAAKSTELWE